MLSVLYTAEENAFREQVREFAERVVAPRAEEIEETEPDQITTDIIHDLLK